MHSTNKIIELIIEEARDPESELGKAVRARQMLRAIEIGSDEEYVYDDSSMDTPYHAKTQELDQKVQYLTEAVEELIMIFDRINDAAIALDKYKTDMRRLMFNESLRQYQGEFPF